MKKKIKQIYKEFYEEHPDAGFYPSDIDSTVAVQDIPGGEYCQGELIVVEVGGDLYGFRAGSHPERGLIDSLNASFGSALTPESEVELQPVIKKEVVKYEIKD
jgi:hypothetical protein